MRVKTRERKKPWIATKRGRNTRKKDTGELVKPFSGKLSNNKDFYNSKEWRATREKVLSQNAVCMWCLYTGKVSPATEADHIIPVDRCESEGINPLDPNNLVPSCRSCNARRASYESKGIHINTFEGWVKYLRNKIKNNA